MDNHATGSELSALTFRASADTATAGMRNQLVRESIRSLADCLDEALALLIDLSVEPGTEEFDAAVEKVSTLARAAVQACSGAPFVGDVVDGKTGLAWVRREVDAAKGIVAGLIR